MRAAPLGKRRRAKRVSSPAAALKDPRELFPLYPIRCPCGGPVSILSNPPGDKAYGVCLVCDHMVTLHVIPNPPAPEPPR